MASTLCVGTLRSRTRLVVMSGRRYSSFVTYFVLYRVVKKLRISSRYYSFSTRRHGWVPVSRTPGLHYTTSSFARPGVYRKSGAVAASMALIMFDFGPRCRRFQRPLNHMLSTSDTAAKPPNCTRSERAFKVTSTDI